MVDIKFHSADKMKTAGWQGKKEERRNIKKTKQKTENNLDFKAGFHFNTLVHLLYKLLFIVAGWSFCEYVLVTRSVLLPHIGESGTEKRKPTQTLCLLSFSDFVD